MDEFHIRTIVDALSDGSEVFAVKIKVFGAGSPLTFDCVSKKDAAQLAAILETAIRNHTNHSVRIV